MNTSYPNSLSEAEWNRLQQFLPARSPHGSLRPHSLRSRVAARCSLLRTGSPWRYLPSNFPPWQTVYYHWRHSCRTGLWSGLHRALHEAERRRGGRDPHPSAAIMAAPRGKTGEEAGRMRGYDAHTCVKGRKQRLLVATLACPAPSTPPQPLDTTRLAHAASEAVSSRLS